MYISCIVSVGACTVTHMHTPHSHTCACTHTNNNKAINDYMLCNSIYMTCPERADSGRPMEQEWGEVEETEADSKQLQAPLQDNSKVLKWSVVRFTQPVTPGKVYQTPTLNG